MWILGGDHIHIYIHTFTHMRNPCIHTSIRKYIHKYMHACTHRHTHLYKITHVYMYMMAFWHPSKGRIRSVPGVGGFNFGSWGTGLRRCGSQVHVLHAQLLIMGLCSALDTRSFPDYFSRSCPSSGLLCPYLFAFLVTLSQMHVSGMVAFNNRAGYLLAVPDNNPSWPRSFSASVPDARNVSWRKSTRSNEAKPRRHLSWRPSMLAR